jgi:hypothetical protein
MRFDPGSVNRSLTCPAAIFAALKATVDAPQQSLAHLAHARRCALSVHLDFT